MTDDIAARAREFYEAVSAGDIDAAVGMFADDFVEHDEFPGLEPTREGVRQFFESFRAAFPDLRFEAEDVFAAGDKAVGRIRMTGTQQGEFMGLPASGRRIDVSGIDIVRFRGEKMVEHWGAFDSLKMMTQLGAVPEPEVATA